MSKAARNGELPAIDDPKRHAGLTQRRRERGQAVGSEPMILDAEGRTVSVGDSVDGGSMGDGRIDAILLEGNEEGGPPQVVVVWPEVPLPERYDTRPRDYRHEGPDFEGIRFWVCDEIEVRP